MVLGRNLYGRLNELLLSKGHVLSPAEILRIKIMDFESVYIGESIFDDLTNTMGLISETLRDNAVHAARGFFFEVDRQNPAASREGVHKLENIVSNMIDEITCNPGATISMNDLRSFDDYTFYHSVNVTVISIILGISMGLGSVGLHKLGLAAMLHDIGKIFVPKDLLNKKEKLGPGEFDKIKSHCVRGSEYLKDKLAIPYESALAALSHHEKYNGSGYPYGIKGNRIPEFAKIVAVADVFDALTSDRPYRKAYPMSEAVEYVMGESRNCFAPEVVEAFMKKVFPYPVGSHVVLSDGCHGIVAENHVNCGLRPKVMIITDSETPEYYDLCGDERLLNVVITGYSDDDARQP